MKKLHLLTTISVGALAIISCTSMPEYNESEAAYPTLTKEQIQKNVEEIFGTTFSSNQDWSSTTQKTISITANADLDDIVKVQILTGSPFMNPDCRVLAEAAAQKGETVQLTFDCPAHVSSIYAACVDSQGFSFVKSFAISDNSVSYKSSNTRAATRAGADDYGFPDLSSFTLDYSNAFFSYNAMRTIRAEQGETYSGSNCDFSWWKGAGWENDRQWRVTSSTTKNGWGVENYSIRRSLASKGFSEDDKRELQDIFENFLYYNNNNKDQHRKNLELIRNSEIVKLYNNQLVSTGDPLVISPVQATSTDLKFCDLYYYYYDPEVVRYMTDNQEVKYIKSLPKFMALSCEDGMEQKSGGSSDFYRNHEYLLPYYGDAPVISTEELNNFTPYNNKVFRIRNGRQKDGLDYYMVYNNQENYRLDTLYSDGNQKLPMQLWQIFKDDYDNCYLYNIGGRAFYYYKKDYNTEFSIGEYVDQNCVTFKMEEVDGNLYHFKRNDTKGIGSDLGVKNNNGIWSDKTSDNGVNFDWYLDEYSGSRTFAPKTKIERISSLSTTAKGYAIPKGYRIGFMLKKLCNDATDCYSQHWSKGGGTNFWKGSYNKLNNGEVYGDGRLNTEINLYPNFSTSMKMYGMLKDDPRVAIFSANGKTYLTFEDGIDANFVDLIFEISNGVELVEPEKIYKGAYTFCFEDRQDGDYDLNDVVIKAQRIDKNHVKYSLEACGAHDELYLRNINGNTLNDKVEVHALFGVDHNTFVNTEDGKKIAPIQDIVEVPEDFSFTDYDSQVYIYNATTGKEIKLSKAGEDPHAIMIPYDYAYPLEKVCVKDANTKFVEWGENPSADNIYWYMEGVEGKIYTQSQFK